MKVIILGAGASKSYSESKTRVKMPVANDFFETYRKLSISENPWVLIGFILNYLKKYHEVEWLDFLKYNGNIEDIHSEIESKLLDGLSKPGDFFETPENLVFLQSYNQLLFLFTSVLNEIQNGPVSKSHLNLVKELNPEDIVITFNWDTLMDRALNSSTNWNSDNGYFVTPKLIYRDNWIKSKAQNKNGFPLLLKLHGSTNWLTSHTHPKDGVLKLSQEISPENFFVYESTVKPYSTYDGRYMDGYEEYSYGYYPPNLPLNGKPLPKGYLATRTILRGPYTPKGQADSYGLNSMPLIIPPVKNKAYDLFGSLFKDIWGKAQDAIYNADEIIIIGYSFPKTDYRTDKLFKNAFVKRSTMPKITILNPYSTPIKERFIFDYGITEDKIKVIEENFTAAFEMNKIFR